MVGAVVVVVGVVVVVVGVVVVGGATVVVVVSMSDSKSTRKHTCRSCWTPKQAIKNRF